MLVSHTGEYSSEQMISGFSLLLMGGKVGRGEIVGEVFILGSEARERGSADSLGSKITPTISNMRTTSMGKSAFSVFSLLLAGFTI